MTKAKLPTYGFEAERDDNGRTKKRLLRSPSRKTLKALRDLEPKALENIEASVNGLPVDKEVLTTSKWLITQTIAVSKHVITEEQELNGIKLRSEQHVEAAEEEEKEEQGKAKFSLHLLPTSSDL